MSGGQGTAAIVGESVASVRARWVEALRSGRYRQTTGDLRNADGYCCLGVLIDVIGYPWEQLSHADGVYRFKPDMTDPCPITSLAMDDLYGLAGMNDHGKSFAEIADYIEALPLPGAA